MGIEIGTLALIGLATSAVGTVASLHSQSQANKASRNAAEEQRKAGAWNAAQNSAQAAAERRQQVREERVKRAQILNSAANTGTSASSGEAGAVGGMATQLGSNIGFNQSMINSGQMIGSFNQSAADFDTQADRGRQRSSQFGQLSSLGTSMFSSVGGWSGLGNNKRLW